MKVMEFINDFKEKKIQNTRLDENAVSKYIRETLSVKTYIPFREKRLIVETVVAANTNEIDGIKRHDAINAFIGFVTAMLKAHTNLEFSNDPVEDYDLLAESGLLLQIITEFQQSYDECNSLLKMALDAELMDNHTDIFVGKFLNDILVRFDTVMDMITDKIGAIDVQDILRGIISNEDLVKLKDFLNIVK
jgi:hypothetical protein